MAIALVDILDERHIALRLKSRRHANTLREIIGLLEKTGSVLQPADLLAQGLARERVNPPLLENGVAFPHARTALVDQIALAVGRSRAGIPWNDKGERARLIFVVAVPQRLVNDYLVLVGTLVRITQNEQQRKACSRQRPPRNSSRPCAAQPHFDPFNKRSRARSSVRRSLGVRLPIPDFAILSRMGSTDSEMSSSSRRVGTGLGTTLNFGLDRKSTRLNSSHLG